MIDEYFKKNELHPNMLICEEKTFNLRWLRVGKEKILQQLMVKNIQTIMKMNGEILK